MSCQAWAQFMRVSGDLLQKVETDLKTAALPPLAWYDVLLEVRRAQPEWLRPVDIQEKMLVKQYNMSRLIDRLVNEDLVVRKSCDCDKRGMYIVLTAKGNELLDDIWPVYKAAIDQHFGDKLNPSEIGDLARILGKL